MIIDVCSYLGFWPFWNVNATTARSLIEILDTFGVDKAAVCSLRSIFYDHDEGNMELSKALRSFPDRFIGIATVNPYYEDVVEEVEECILDFNMKGIELQPNYHGYNLGSSILAPIINVAIKTKAPVLIPLRISMDWNLPTIKVSNISEVVKTYTDANFIVGCFNYGEIEELISLMNDVTNVMVESSGLQLMYGIERVVKEVGAERVLFGSGMPIQSVGAALAKIKKADIDEEDKRLILGDNAIRVLNLNE